MKNEEKVNSCPEWRIDSELEKKISPKIKSNTLADNKRKEKEKVSEPEAISLEADSVPDDILILEKTSEPKSACVLEVAPNSHFIRKQEDLLMNTSNASLNQVNELSEEEQLKILFERLDLSDNIRRMNASAREDMAEIIEKSVKYNELELERELPVEDMTVVKNDDGFFVATSDSEDISIQEATQDINFFKEETEETVDQMEKNKEEDSSLISIEALITDEPAPPVFDAGIVTPVFEEGNLIIEPSPLEQHRRENVVEENSIEKTVLQFEETPKIESEKKPTINVAPKQASSPKQKKRSRRTYTEKVVKTIGIGKKIYYKIKLK